MQAELQKALLVYVAYSTDTGTQISANAVVTTYKQNMTTIQAQHNYTGLQVCHYLLMICTSNSLHRLKGFSRACITVVLHPWPLVHLSHSIFYNQCIFILTSIRPYISEQWQNLHNLNTNTVLTANNLVNKKVPQCQATKQNSPDSSSTVLCALGLDLNVYSAKTWPHNDNRIQLDHTTSSSRFSLMTWELL